MKILPFEVPEIKNDVPVQLFSQLFRLNSSPTALSPSVIPATPSKLQCVTTLYQATKDLFASRYRYFRADIRIVVKINSTPLDYGWFTISWYPSDTVTTTLSAFSPYNADPWLFSVSTGGVHEIIIPYCSVYDGYSLRANEEAQGFSPPLPMVYLTSWGGGTLANTYAVSLTFEIGWHNFKAWGVTPYALDDPINLLEEELEIAAGQMMTAATMTGAVLTGAQVFKQAKDVASAVNDGYKTVQGLHTWTKEGLADLNANIGSMKETYQEAFRMYETVKQPLYDIVDIREHEAQDGTVRNSPAFVSGLTNMGYTPIENFSCTQVRIDTEGLCDEQRVHYIRDMIRIPCIHTFAEFTSGTTVTMLVAPFPGLGYGNASNFQYGNQMLPDYLAQGAQFFRKWRGSIDYSLCFDTSTLARATLTIRVDQLGSEKISLLAAYNPLTEGRYLFKKTIEVTGKSQEDITVPFVFNQRWCPNQALWDLGSGGTVFQNAMPSRLIITCETISTSQIGTGVAPKVEMMVLRSAGSDFQLSNFAGGEFDRVAPALEKAVGQMRVREKPQKFSNIFGGPEPRKLRPVPEDELTWEDLLSRWSARRVPSSFALWTPGYPVDMAGVWASQNTLYRAAPLPDYFDYITNMFRYYRGNEQMKIVTAGTFAATTDNFEATMRGDNALVPGNIADNDAISAGTAWTFPALNPVLEYEQPIESYNTDWLVTPAQTDSILHVPIPLQVGVNATDITARTDCSYFVRKGRGYQIAFLAPPMENWWSLYPTMNLA